MIDELFLRQLVLTLFGGSMASFTLVLATLTAVVVASGRDPGGHP